MNVKRTNKRSPVLILNTILTIFLTRGLFSIGDYYSEFTVIALAKDIACYICFRYEAVRMKMNCTNVRKRLFSGAHVGSLNIADQNQSYNFIQDVQKMITYNTQNLAFMENNQTILGKAYLNLSM